MILRWTIMLMLVNYQVYGKYVSLSYNEQKNAMHHAAIQCYTKMFEQMKNQTQIEYSVGKTNATYTTLIVRKSCPIDYDGIACWPETPAGTNATMSCPNYIHGFDMSAIAYRICTEEGTWRFSVRRNTTAAKYYACYQEFNKLKSLSDVAESGSMQKFSPLITKHMTNIQMISVIGYSTSIVALVAAVITLSSMKKLLKSPRNILHLNLFISFILRGVFTLAHSYLVLYEQDVSLKKYIYDSDTGQFIMDPSNSHWECKLLTAVWMYSRLCNCMWIFLEALYLHLLIFVLTFSNKSGTKSIIAAGWGVPLLFIIPWVAVRISLDNVECWIIYDNRNYRWIIEAPALVIVLVNFGFFTNFLRLLFTKLKASESNGVRMRVSRKLAKSTVILIPLFGVHYMVFFFTEFSDSMNESLTISRFYFDTIFTAFQGLAVAVLFCFINEEVKVEIKNKWIRFKLNKGWITHNVQGKRPSTQRISLSSECESRNPSRRQSSAPAPNAALLTATAVKPPTYSNFLSPHDHEKEEKFALSITVDQDENQNTVRDATDEQSNLL